VEEARAQLVVMLEEVVAVRQATSGHRNFELPFLRAMVHVRLEAVGAQVSMVRGNCICKDRNRRHLAGSLAVVLKEAEVVSIALVPEALVKEVEGVLVGLQLAEETLTQEAAAAVQKAWKLEVVVEEQVGRFLARVVPGLERVPEVEERDQTAFETTEAG
jgi:hypothetical protein